MSGLALLYHLDGRPVDGGSVEAMLDAAPHRGPDGQSVRIWPAIGLGQAKLAITAEDEEEQQPLVSPRSGCAIVADARLDNRAELLAHLTNAPPNASDADLILRAFETWGSDAAPRLLGDFAYAIWDPRRQQLTCARDTSGQRPLFYRCDGATFAAASEIQQLLQDPGVAIVPNEARIRDYLTPFRAFRNEQEQETTFYEGIFSLQAGHLLVLNGSEPRLSRYWELRPPRQLRYKDEYDYAGHFANVLGESVRARLRSSRPVGATLSGGLDSSSIVSLAQNIMALGLVDNHGFTTFSLLFGGLECDESQLIRDVQAKYGFDARYLLADGTMSNFEAEPRGFMRGPSMPATSFDVLLNAASNAGVRVLLSGALADNALPWSWGFLGSLLRRGRFVEFSRYLRRYRRVSYERARKTVAFQCLLPLLPLALQRPLRTAYARREFARQRAAMTPSWISPGIREVVLARHLDLTLDAERSRRFLDDSQEMIFQSLYPGEVFPTSGAYPTQMAQPFADRRLHEFMLSLPPEQVFEPHPYSDDFYSGHKVIMRRGLTGILPESVRTRAHKTLFTSYVVDEFSRRWPEYEAAFGPGAKSEISARGYVDPPLFWQRLEGMREGKFGEDGMHVSRMLYLETWLRTFCLPRGALVSVAPISRTLPVAPARRL